MIINGIPHPTCVYVGPDLDPAAVVVYIAFWYRYGQVTHRGLAVGKSMLYPFYFRYVLPVRYIHHYQIRHAISIEIIAGDGHFGIAVNADKTGFYRVRRIAVVDHVDALAHLVLKEQVAPNIDLCRVNNITWTFRLYQ